MEDDQEVLDEIFGPGAPKTGGTQQAPSPPARAAGAPPPASTKKATVKKVAVKKPTAGPASTDAGSSPDPSSSSSYSPYTSGYGAQQFPLGMKEMGDDSLLQSGIKAFDEKRFEEALNYFKIVLVSDRTNAQAKFFMEKTRERMGLGAEEKKKKVVEEDPIMSREEAFGTKLDRPSSRPSHTSTGSVGVYRMPPSDLGGRKHEYARESVGIDTGLDRTRIIIIIVMISMGLGAAAYLSMTM